MEFYIYFRLPDGMRVSQSDGESTQPDAMPNGKWRIYNADGAVAGAFSFDEYEPNPEGGSNEREDVETIASLISIVVGEGKSPFMGKTNSLSHAIIFPR